MNPPKSYLSYSQLNLFLQSPEEYYRRYFLKEEFEPNDAMRFGSKIHKVLENRTIDVNTLNLDVNQLLIANKVREEIPILDGCEIKLLVQHEPINLLAIFDGIHDNTIYEYKTCKSHWTQRRVDESLQLTFYTFVYIKKFKRMPNLKLISISSTSGKHKTFSTMRTLGDLEELQDKINYFVKTLGEM